jgi:hypothetical protein
VNARTVQERRCPWCRAPVHPQARVCPHCAYRGLMSGIPTWLMLAALIGMNYAMYSAEPQLLPSILQPKPLTGEVHVVASQMMRGIRDGKPVIAVVCRVQNDAPDAYECAALEVQFTDASGRLVDVRQGYPRPRTVPPHGEAAFCWTFVPDLPVDEYASHEVFVRAAPRPGSFF